MMRSGSIAVLLLAGLVLVQSDRLSKLQTTSSTQGPNDHKEKNYDPKKGPFATLDIDRYLVKTAYGLTPEQVSVNYWAPGTYLFSWVTGDAQVGLGLTAPDPSLVASTVTISTSSNLANPTKAQGKGVSYVYQYSLYEQYNLLDYASGIIHHTLVKNLKPGTTYYYTVGDDKYATSKVYNFTTVPAKFPVKFGIMADTGQSLNSSQTLDHMLAFSKPDIVLNIGDLTYADTFDSRGTLVCWLSQTFDSNSGAPFFLPGGGKLTAQCQTDLPPQKEESADTYQPKYDSWARLWERVFSFIPTMHVSGNHELDLQPDGTLFEAYNARYPQPQNPKYVNTNPVSYFSDKSDNNLYASAEIPGIATVFMINTLAPQVTFGGPNDKQYKWFKKALAAVNRTETPWVLVGFHIPVYSTDAFTFKAEECFRIAYEPLFYQYGVDIVFNGHVHAYERTYPVYNYTRDDCGAIHLVVGSGGNNEGVSNLGGWIDQVAATQSFCLNPTSRQFSAYQPQRCFSYQDQYAKYCPDKMPDWAAFRHTAFGSGLLTIIDANTAKWEWHSNLAGVHEVEDEVTIVRGRDKCTAQRK